MILASPETLSDLAWAAERRYREAENLLAGGHYSGAVYLCGLPTEMWLKQAAAKLTALPANTPVPGLLGPVRTWMSVHAPAIQREAYHSLRFWSEYLRLRRAYERRPMPASLAGQLRHHVVNRLFEDWKIDVRYRQVSLSPTEALRVYNDAAWVRATWDQLWR